MQAGGFTREHVSLLSESFGTTETLSPLIVHRVIPLTAPLILPVVSLNHRIKGS